MHKVFEHGNNHRNLENFSLLNIILPPTFCIRAEAIGKDGRKFVFRKFKSEEDEGELMSKYMILMEHEPSYTWIEVTMHGSRLVIEDIIFPPDPLKFGNYDKMIMAWKEKVLEPIRKIGGNTLWW